MFNLGDLVKVAEYCPLEDYAGKVGIVTATLGPDYTMANELGYHYNFDSTDGPESCWVPHKYIKSIAMSRKPDVNEEPLN